MAKKWISLELSNISFKELERLCTKYPEIENWNHKFTSCNLERETHKSIQEMCDVGRWLIFLPFIAPLGINSRCIPPNLSTMNWYEMSSYKADLDLYRFTKLSDLKNQGDIQVTYWSREIVYEVTQQMSAFVDGTFLPIAEKSLLLSHFKKVVAEKARKPYTWQPELLSIMRLTSTSTGATHWDFKKELAEQSLGPFAAINIYYEGPEAGTKRTWQHKSVYLLRKDLTGIYQFWMLNIPVAEIIKTFQ